MKAAFLINPSQRWKKTPTPKIIALIQSKIPVPSEFFTVDRTQPRSLENHLETIAAGTFDTIIIGAGDGTINRTINFLKQKNALGAYTLGLFPLGTCNDFAKILGFRKGRTLRQNLQLAGEIIGRRSTREIAVATVNNHCFINNAGFGRRNPSQKKRGLLAELRALKAIPTAIRWDSQTHHESFLMMLAANAPYFSNGLHFSNDSDPSDDFLEFFFVRNISKFRLLAKLFLGVRGFSMMRRHRSDQAIWKAKARELTLKTDLPIWIMADGEIVPSLSEITEASFKTAGRVRFLTAR